LLSAKGKNQWGRQECLSHWFTLFAHPFLMSFWQNKVALVTGGSSGLGRVIAEVFGGAGAKVALVGLEADAVQQAAGEMQAAGRDVLGVCGDITRQDDVDRLLAQTLERFGRLDVLVNNAGRSMRGKVLDTTPEQFRDLMELNLIALVRCTRAAAPHLLQQHGHVVNIGSLAAKSAARWVGAYPATKFAVAAYSQQLRLELGPQGLHVLLVCPGPIERKDVRLYPLKGLEDVPECARAPGAGVQVRGIRPEQLAAAILRACERRRPELVIPGKARLLFAIAQLWPSLGDWIVRRKTGQ
jgi:uncharacterized protein